MTAVAINAELCLCDKHMFEYLNEGTCLWCGHGLARAVREHAYQRNMEATPGRVIPISKARSYEWDHDECAMAAIAWWNRHGSFPGSGEWNQPKLTGEHRPSYHTVISRFGSWKSFKEYCSDIPRQATA